MKNKKNKLFPLWASGFCFGMGWASVSFGFTLYFVVNIVCGLVLMWAWYVMNEN